MPKSVRCVSQSCRHKIDPGWWFCPYCGADNRPPSQRQEIAVHTHEYLYKVGYSLVCGEAHNELPGYTARSRINTASTFMALAVLLRLCILNIQLAHHDGPAIAKGWIQSWYDNPVRDSSGTQGTSTCLWMFILAIFCLISSLKLFFKYQSPYDNAYWMYEDDKPWWRRRGWPWW